MTDWMDGQMDGWMEGWMERWVNELPSQDACQKRFCASDGSEGEDHSWTKI